VTARISPIGALIRITDLAKFLSQMNQLAKAPLAESAAMEIQARAGTDSICRSMVGLMRLMGLILPTG